MDVSTKRNWDAFCRALPALLAEPGNRGRFALVHEQTVADLYPTFDAALDAGYDRFGLNPFIVQEVTDKEEPVYFSRNVTACP